MDDQWVINPTITHACIIKLQPFYTLDPNFLAGTSIRTSILTFPFETLFTGIAAVPHLLGHYLWHGGALLQTQVPKVVMGGTSEILKVHKMSFGVGHGKPYTIRVWYILPLEMVREICHTWRLGRYPDPLFCKEYDIWCETLWFYWMCIVHLRHDSDEVFNPPPKKARWPSTKMDLRTEQIFCCFFLGRSKLRSMKFDATLWIGDPIWIQ